MSMTVRDQTKLDDDGMADLAMSQPGYSSLQIHASDPRLGGT